MPLYNNINKGLDKITSPLIKQSVEYLITKIGECATDEEADIAKTALLIYLHSSAPELLKANAVIASSLQKSHTGQSTIDAEKELKALLAKGGIYYFGSLSTELDKHNTKLGRPGDPDAPGDKKFPNHARPPHVEVGGAPMVGPGDPPLPSQGEHAHGVGTREMIGYLRDLQHLFPNLEFGQRQSLMGQNRGELMDMVSEHLPGFFDKGYAIGRGKSLNTRRQERLANIRGYLRNEEHSITGQDKASALSQISDALAGLGHDDRVDEGTPQAGHDKNEDGTADVNSRGESTATRATTEEQKAKRKARAAEVKEQKKRKKKEELPKDAAAARLKAKKKGEKINQRAAQALPRPTGSAWNDVDAAAQQIHTEINDSKFKAGTFNGKTLKSRDDESGYYVAFKKNEAADVPFTPERIAQYLNENMRDIRKHNLGVWTDQDTGKGYLDVSRHIEDLKAAVEFGVKNEQLSIWDIAAGTEIKLTPENVKRITSGQNNVGETVHTDDGNADETTTNTEKSANTIQKAISTLDILIQQLEQKSGSR